jgi:hypothetical protein
VAAAMKVFISFATEDASTAESLFADIHRAGADVFKWGRTEEVGKPTWPQILKWISESDVFIVLISRHALESLAVNDEIDQAAHSHTNRRKPELIISAIIDPKAAPPIVIERFAHLDLVDFESGRERLMTKLGLKRHREPASDERSMRLVVKDPDRLFKQHREKYPDPYRIRPHPVLTSSELFTSPKKDPWQVLLDPVAPVLTLTADLRDVQLRWTTPEQGCHYILQRSRKLTFADPETIFEGAATAHEDERNPFIEYHYRVRAVSAGGESRWSNVVSSNAE